MTDQFTVFAKDVGDADLFATAKASLVVVLELLEENKEAVSGFAASIGVVSQKQSSSLWIRSSGSLL